ncbi:MAG: Fic family protein [Pseudonocardiaceae bacterium]
MSIEERLQWGDVEPLDVVNGELRQVLASVDTLREAWELWLNQASAAELAEARRRSLRRHAIETGIIERLYDVDWGVTEALVAEGITAEVAAREGGLDDDALTIIRTQYDALEFLADAARDGRDLSLHFVRELHQAVCGAQATYEARNDLGQVLQVTLHHGAWKTQPNHVRRQDGRLLEYTPPEHVQSQMQRLLELYRKTGRAHPVVRAAWLHHRFIRIHPFEDGNGRVARALTLLVLLGARYAPLVVDRTQRGAYIDALDQANGGDLRDLTRLFARLEIVALRSELERPTEPIAERTGALGVARAYAQRLRELQQAELTERTTRAEALARELHNKIVVYLEELGSGVRDQFGEADPQARSSIDHASPPDDRARFWSLQIIRTAREVDFFTNISKGSWWTRLHLVVLGQTLRFVVAIQRVGQGETGVLAVTVFAEAVTPRASEDDDRPLPTPLFRSTPADSVTLAFSDDPEARWAEISELIDNTLAAAVARFAQQLG